MVLERSLQFPVFSLSPRCTSSNSTGVSLRIFQPGQPKSEASEMVGVPEEAAEGWAPWAALQYTCLGNPMDRGAWQATVPGVAKSWT